MCILVCNIYLFISNSPLVLFGYKSCLDVGNERYAEPFGFAAKSLGRRHSRRSTWPVWPVLFGPGSSSYATEFSTAGYSAVGVASTRGSRLPIQSTGPVLSTEPREFDARPLNAASAMN